MEVPLYEVALYPTAYVAGDEPPARAQLQGSEGQGGAVSAEVLAIDAVELGQIPDHKRGDPPLALFENRILRLASSSRGYTIRGKIGSKPSER